MLIQLCGQAIELLPRHALYWPARSMLLVADIHFGKAAAFRAQGIPVPHGTTTENLAALDALLATREVRHLVFLGDFLHAKASRATATMAALSAWRARHADLVITLVRGNHDAHAGDPPASLGMRMVDEPYEVGPFALCHHPDTRTDHFVIAGHVHPVVKLVGLGDRLRLPCFVINADCCILPAFGSFTGGHAMVEQAGQDLYLVADEEVMVLPRRSASSHAMGQRNHRRR